MITMIISFQFAPSLRFGYSYNYSLLYLVAVMEGDSMDAYPYVGPYYTFRISLFKPFFFGFSRKPMRNLNACIPVDVDNAFSEYRYIEGGITDDGSSISFGVYFINAGVCREGSCKIKKKLKMYDLKLGLYSSPFTIVSIRKFATLSAEIPMEISVLFTDDTTELMGKRIPKVDFAASIGINLVIDLR